MSRDIIYYTNGYVDISGNCQDPGDPSLSRNDRILNVLTVEHLCV